MKLMLKEKKTNYILHIIITTVIAIILSCCVVFFSLKTTDNLHPSDNTTTIGSKDLEFDYGSDINVKLGDCFDLSP